MRGQVLFFNTKKLTTVPYRSVIIFVVIIFSSQADVEEVPQMRDADDVNVSNQFIFFFTLFLLH